MKKLIILSIIIINNAFALDLEEKVVEAQLVAGEEIVKTSLLERNEKYLIIEIMSTDCRTCIASMPALFKLSQTVGDNVLMKTIAIDRVLELDSQFFKEQADLIIYPFVFDYSRDVAKMFEIRLTPTAFILDENNKVIFKHVGLLEDNEADKMAAILVE